MSLRMFWNCVIAVMLVAIVVMASGCSGGVSISAGAGGSIYNPDHVDAAEIVKNTPIIETTTRKSWGSLPMVGEKKK